MRAARVSVVGATIAILFLSLAPATGASLATEGTWVRTGGPLGGLGYDVRMNQDNPDIMLVSDAWAGVFRSEDGGTTWTPSNEGITARTGPSGDGIPIFSLTIDPHDPSIVWTGTQGVRGIYRSDDGGQTWAEMVRGIVESEGITFRGFTVDPRSSDIVYAAAELSSWVWAGEERPGREFDRTAGVVYKTEDRGNHWTPVWRGDNLARYIWIDPNEPDVLYLSTGIFDREAANSDPGPGDPGGEGVLKSTDGGMTWANVNEGLGNLYVGSLALSPHDPQILLAGTGNNQYFEGGAIYLSIDGAETWNGVGASENITSVEFTSDPAIMYAASAHSVYRSDDGGERWNRVSGTDPFIGWGPSGVRAGFPIDIQADPRDPDRLFVNSYGGGNFLSADGGRTWEMASSGYTGAQVRDIATDPSEPGRVYASARSGLFVSDDGGATWTGLNYGNVAALDHHLIAIDPIDPMHVTAATNWSRSLFASSDAGRHWRSVGPDVPEMMGWQTMVYAPSDPSIAYAGSGGYYSAGQFSWELPADGIYVSHDGGYGWNQINTAVSSGAQVADLAVHPEFVGFVYAASTNSGLLRTYDGGVGWESVVGGLPEGAMALSVAFDPHDPAIQMAGYASQGVFRSTDGGETWSRVAAGLPAESVITDIVFDPHAPGIVYASDLSSGVYLSEDAGTTWSAITEGLRTRAINGLALSADGLHLYAATEGEGVYRYDVAGTPPAAAEPLTPPELTPPPTTTQPQPPVTTAPGTTAPTTAPTATTVAAVQPDEGGEAGGAWVPIGAGVAGAIALAAAGWLLIRRRRG